MGPLAFNILNFQERPVFIDFSQCATNQSTIYNVYLERDARNIAKFFSKHKLAITGEEIIKKIERSSVLCYLRTIIFKYI